MYDPDYTGTGHQPLGFDAMASRYQHFVVLGSKIKCTFINTTTSQVNMSACGITLTGAASEVNSANVNLILENRNHTKWTMGGIIVSLPLPSKTQTFSAKKFFSKRVIVGDANYQGSSSAGPTEQAYFVVWCAAIGGNDPGACEIFVELEYIAVWTEPIQFAVSD